MEEEIKVYTRFMFDGQFEYQNVWYKNPPTYCSLHYHPTFEILLFVEGDAYFSVEGEKYSLTHNDLMITRKDEFHCEFFYSDTPYARKILYIKPPFIASLNTDEYNPLINFNKKKFGRNNKIDCSIVEREGIPELFDEIENDLRIDTPARHFMLRLHSALLLAKISELLEQSDSPSSSNDRITNLINYINHNLSGDLSYEALSKHFFVNKDYLCRTFKLQTGFTIGEYVKNKRIIKAKELLLKGVPAQEVSDMVGYCDYPTFYRMFKKITAQSPRDFVNRSGINNV